MAVDYKRLLKMALLSWLEAEGGCWVGRWDGKQFGIPRLNKEEQVALQEVLNEIGEIKGEEFKVDDFVWED